MLFKTLMPMILSIAVVAACNFGDRATNSDIWKSAQWEGAETRTMRLGGYGNRFLPEWKFAVIDSIWHALIPINSKDAGVVISLPMVNGFELTFSDSAAHANAAGYIASIGGEEGYSWGGRRNSGEWSSGYAVRHWVEDPTGPSFVEVAGDKPYVDILDKYLSRNDLFDAVVPVAITAPSTTGPVN
jgi:hypothetical protein